MSYSNLYRIFATETWVWFSVRSNQRRSKLPFTTAGRLALKEVQGQCGASKMCGESVSKWKLDYKIALPLRHCFLAMQRDEQKRNFNHNNIFRMWRRESSSCRSQDTRSFAWSILESWIVRVCVLAVGVFGMLILILLLRVNTKIIPCLLWLVFTESILNKIDRFFWNS